jgi:hypothetical protein
MDLIKVVALASLLFTSTAFAQADERWVCTRSNGKKVRAIACTLRPTPTPIFTTSPVPTQSPAIDCSGGTFVTDTVTSLKWLNRSYPPGETVKLCANVPWNAAGRFMYLNSTNKSNSSCNVLDVWLVSPSGKYYTSRGVQPGAAMTLEPGKWQVTVLLDPDPLTACSRNFPFDFFLSWF